MNQTIPVSKRLETKYLSSREKWNDLAWGEEGEGGVYMMAFVVGLPCGGSRNFHHGLKHHERGNSAAAHGRRMTLHAQMDATALASAKRAMFDVISTSNLGRAALEDPRLRKEIDEYISKVETMNAVTTPVSSPLLSGTWKLVYTDSEEILGTKRPFPWLRPTDEIYQLVDVAQARVVNKEEITVPILGTVKNSVRAQASIEPPKRVRVRFEQFQFGPFKVKAPETARGYLDTTYLDETLRIARGNKKHVFVMTRSE